MSIMLTFNGKPFDPKEFEKALLKGMAEKVAEHLHDKASAVRDPETGEFPTVVVSGTSFDRMEMLLEGSPEVLALAHDRLGLETITEESGAVVLDEPPAPRVFLSYTFEDTDVARKIAEALMENGIDTWWAEWSLSAGDSLRREIEAGLRGSTHFVVLLTPHSIEKPWVNLEIDAGVMRMLKEKAKVIVLRHDLPVDRLPELLCGTLSPEVKGPDYDIKQLIHDIHGISKKPALGKPPKAVAEKPSPTGFSVAANTVAKLFVESTEHARKFDPQIPMDEVVRRTGLSEEDVVDAVHELHGMAGIHYGYVYPEDELFARFDRFWMQWNPSEDALTLAADLINDSEFPTGAEEISIRYGWNARRLNSAMAFLINRKIVNGASAVATEWLAVWLTRTDATRRFVKSRQ